LFDQDDVTAVGVLVDREDHRGVNAARARDIFPIALLLDRDEAAFPPRLDGGVGGSWISSQI
jgi:hypothetical protein